MQTTQSDHPLAVEVTSAVAKLLGRENITIQRGSFVSAWFDPKRRVLGLPILKHETKSISDLFVGHEIGHALYTPVNMSDRWKIEVPGVSFDVCNVLEDIRIERKIQREYPGLIQAFRKGYSDLWNNGFFGIEENQLTSLSFLDRLNLKAKMPNLEISFTESEKPYVDMAMSVRTPDDVYEVGRKLAKAVKKDENTPEEYSDSSEDDNTRQNDESGESGNQGESGDSRNPGESETLRESSQNDALLEDDSLDQNESTENDQESSTNEEDDSGSNSVSDAGKDLESNALSSEAVKNMEKNIQENVNTNYTGFNFLTPTQEELQATVNSYKDIIKSRKDPESRFFKFTKSKQERLNKLYQEFQKKSKPFVASLHREFEQKKAAFQWSRSKPAQKGVIDVNQLHRYRYEENIFSTVTQLADAKSHGMVFMLDFSGSMANTIDQTIEYVLNLTEFCRSTSIPFEVYTFTSGVNKNSANEITAPAGTIRVGGVAINQILSSKMTKNEYQTATRDLYYLSKMLGTTDHTATDLEGFGGTPLLEALIVLNHLVLDFQKSNSHQVTNVMILTDGDGLPLDFAYCNQRFQKSYRGGGHIGYGRICGGRYRKINFSCYESTYQALLENIQETCNANVIGFFLVSHTTSVRKQIHQRTDYSKVSGYAAKFRAQGMVAIENANGYDKFILFQYKHHRNNNNNVDSFKKVDIDGKTATNNALAKQFIKFNTSKKANRIFVTEFVKTISSNL